MHLMNPELCDVHTSGYAFSPDNSPMKTLTNDQRNLIFPPRIDIIKEHRKPYAKHGSNPADKPNRIDHDRLFKELFQTFFSEFVELFFPEVHEHVDFSHFHFLPQEVFTDVTSGEKRSIDILAETKLKGEKAAILIHVENQSYAQTNFQERLFIYFSRLYENYRKRIIPIAVFSHDEKRTEPDQFTIAFPFKDVLQFNFYKVELKKVNWRDYIRQDNPVAAALLSHMGYTEAERVEVKLEFLRMLVRLQLDPARMQLINGFFDTYLQLNDKEEVKLKEQIKQLDPQEADSVFRIEPIAMRKGRLEGFRIGKIEGLEEGERKKELQLIHAMLRKEMDVDLIAEIVSLPVEEIEEIKEQRLRDGGEDN